MELETIHKGRWKRLLNKLSWPRVPNIRLEKSLFSIDQIKKIWQVCEYFEKSFLYLPNLFLLSALYRESEFCY